MPTHPLAGEGGGESEAMIFLKGMNYNRLVKDSFLNCSTTSQDNIGRHDTAAEDATVSISGRMWTQKCVNLSTLGHFLPSAVFAIFDRMNFN